MKLKNILSLRAWMVLGFSVAITPFFLGFLYATFAMRDLSVISRSMNAEIFEQTKTIGQVLLKASDLERKARLFVLLSDPALRQPYERQSYENARVGFKNALSKLLKLPLDNKIALLGNEFLAKENLIYQQIINAENENLQHLPIDEAFQGFRETSNSLSSEIENSVDLKFRIFSENAQILEQKHFYAGFLVLFLSLLFIAALLTRVTKAIRQLDSAVRRMSSGDLSVPVAVSGPADLSDVGMRLERLRQQALERDHSKQHFISNLSNEMRMPLNTMQADAESLANEAAAHMNRSAQKLVSSLTAEIDKLAMIYQQLLRYSRLNVETETQVKQLTAADEVLAAVLESFQTQIRQKSLSLTKSSEPVQLYCVPAELLCIFEQLLANALKFSPQQGEIRMILRRTAEEMQFEIEDEGPGIAIAHRQSAFQPFFRMPTPMGDYAGVPDVGLAIVRHYAVKYQGQVDIIDSSPDRLGTRILLKIPFGEDN